MRKGSNALIFCKHRICAHSWVDVTLLQMSFCVVNCCWQDPRSELYCGWIGLGYRYANLWICPSILYSSLAVTFVNILIVNHLVATAYAGQDTEFIIEARDIIGNLRVIGDDQFNVEVEVILHQRPRPGVGCWPFRLVGGMSSRPVEGKCLS